MNKGMDIDNDDDNDDDDDGDNDEIDETDEQAIARNKSYVGRKAKFIMKKMKNGMISKLENTM